MQRAVTVLFFLLVVSPWGRAESGGADSLLTGNVRVDLFGMRNLREGPLLGLQDTIGGVVDGTKSPWLAAGMSLVVPGSGQLYAKSYWKAAGFFALDVVAWLLAYTYDKKGDDQTEQYQAFADAHWSVVQYATFSEGLVPAGKTYDWRIPGTEGLDPFNRPWEQVIWSEVNRMERDIGGYYSHTLPPYGEQQYYELIGKYPQFNQGWNDAPPTFTYGDPLTANFLSYSAERGKANDYYSTATTWVTVAVVNHVLSAIDAAWSTASYNSGVRARAHLQAVPGERSMVLVPSVTVSYGLPL
jgi:hypothetical protein